MPAPIALFCYNRPNHVRRTLEALKANDLASESDLYLFADGWKGEADRGKVEETRRVLESVTGFKSVTRVFSPQNRGLADSIISGVTSIVEDHGRVVVLEDDLLTSPGFLNYLNDGLDLYEGDDRVISIHGYLCPVKADLPETFFLRGTDCWGWATWKRGWDLFEKDGARLKYELNEKGLVSRFDFGGAYSYSAMLDAQIAGKNDSWAVRWYASALIHDKLTLFPGRSLVFNIGHDEEATHTLGRTNAFDVNLGDSIKVSEVPVREDEAIYTAFAHFFQKISHTESRQGRPAFSGKRVLQLMKKVLKRILPSILLSAMRSLRYSPPSYEFFGNFPNWESAKAASSGYDSPDILSKVRTSLLAVKEGRAIFERDSVLFEKPDYSWMLLATLYRVALEGAGRLSVMDFGGSLGSAYFQCRGMLGEVKHLEWSVVEQPHFVEEGRKTFQDEVLKFYPDISSCFKDRRPNLALLSGVLAYLPEPYSFLTDLMGYGFEYILVDKTRVISDPQDRLTVQKVRPTIYAAAYPAWFFSEAGLLKAFEGRYKLLGDSGTHEKAGVESEFKGFLFQRTAEDREKHASN